MRIRSFCNAAAMGDVGMLQRLLKTGIDINGVDCDGRCGGWPIVITATTSPESTPLTQSQRLIRLCLAPSAGLR
jgi:hypothetical protein